MSDHTLCDKCGKVIDKSEPYLQVTVTELVVSDGTSMVQNSTTTYDYHPQHSPKFEKAKPEEPVEPPPEEPAPE